MKSKLVRAALALGLNALALWVASLVLDDMSINGVSFVVAVVIFTLVSLVARPMTRSVLNDHAPALAFLVALIGTFLALLVTDLLSDGLDIEGIGTWILATVIVWLATLVLELLTRSIGQDQAST